MNFIKKIFSSNVEKTKSKSNAMVIFLDQQLKKSIQIVDQTILNYEIENSFEPEQFLYLIVVNRKTNEIMFKRRLNYYQKFSEVMTRQGEQYKAYVILGEGTHRNSIPKINSSIPFSENIKYIRSGQLQKFSQAKNVFQDCQLKLHHDYLTFHRSKQIQKKISFLSLQNSSIEIVNEKKFIFVVKDKFKSIIFKTSSKEDMYGWLMAINEAIKIRNSQIYMNEMESKLHKSIHLRLEGFIKKCLSLKDHSRILPLDEIGRKALKTYFKNQKINNIDNKMLSIIEAYLHMCKCRREKGEAYSQQIINKIKEGIKETESEFPAEIKLRNMQSKNEFVKTIEQIMQYLDNKYRKEIVEKKNIHGVFQNYLLEQYKQEKKIPLKTLFGKDVY